MQANRHWVTFDWRTKLKLRPAVGFNCTLECSCCCMLFCIKLVQEKLKLKSQMLAVFKWWHFITLSVSVLSLLSPNPMTPAQLPECQVIVAQRASSLSSLHLNDLIASLKSTIKIFSCRKTKRSKKTDELKAVKCLTLKVNSAFSCHLRKIICQFEIEKMAEKKLLLREKKKSIAKKVEGFKINFIFCATERKLKV